MGEELGNRGSQRSPGDAEDAARRAGAPTQPRFPRQSCASPSAALTHPSERLQLRSYKFLGKGAALGAAHLAPHWSIGWRAREARSGGSRFAQKRAFQPAGRELRVSVTSGRAAAGGGGVLAAGDVSLRFLQAGSLATTPQSAIVGGYLTQRSERRV